MNYILSFCKITAASKLFSRNFYLPLLKPLTPQDALRTFRITGKWLLGSKIQHYIPTLLNHSKKRSKKEKNYGKIKHKSMEEFAYMTPVLDPDNIESHRNLCNVLNGRKGKDAFVYSVDDKNYNLVVNASIEFAIRDGDIIDVLMSQGTDKILIKMKDFKKVPVQIQPYIKNGTLYKGEGTTTKEDERFHHHGKLTMSLAKIFEDLERKEEQWEKELKRLVQRKKRLPIEGTKEWNEMLKAATANMDWKKYEKQAKRIVQYIEEPIVEYHIGMEVDFDKTKHVDILLKEKEEVTSSLPTLSEIPEIINSLTNAVLHEYEYEGTKTVSGAKVTLTSGKECFIVGQMVKSEDGEVFVPGQTVENEFGEEYAPGITIYLDDEPTLVRGLIVGDADNKNPMFAPIESSITEAGHLSFTVTHEERVKYKPRKVPVRKVIKTINENPEDNYEEYYYDEDFAEELVLPKKRLRRIVKKRKIIPPGCVYSVNEADTYEEEEYSEYEEVEEDEDVIACEEVDAVNAVEIVAGDVDELADKETEPTLEEIIEQYKNSVDPRIQVYKEQLEEERMWLKAIDTKITELIVNIETKTDEVKEKLEELRNLTIVKEIDPISTATMDDALEIANKITDHLKDANVISDIMLTMARRVLTFPDKNSINIENINNANIINSDSKSDEQSQRNEKLKIILKTALVAAYNVFKNRPQDEVSALKAIGTVLTLALEDQPKLLSELCDTMHEPLERSEICVQLLKELCQKRRKDKLKTLKSVVNENEKEVKNDLKAMEKLRDVLDKQGDMIGPAFKKIAKNNILLLKRVIELVKPEVKHAKTEDFAATALEDAIVRAVKDAVDDKLNEFIKNSKQNDVKEFIAEAVSFAQVLGLNSLSHDLCKLPLNSKVALSNDKACLTFLKRIVLIRELARYDHGQTAALKELKKNPEFGKKNPRIRQLIRESAALVSNSSLLKTSSQIPSKLIEENNHIALEDYLIQKSRISFPVLVTKNGHQAILPHELTEDVLSGRIPYLLVDEEGISNMRALQKGRNFTTKDDDTTFGSNKSNKNEKWAEVPNYGKIDLLMLFKPVYIKPKMIEAPIIMGSPPQPQPQPPELREPEVPPEPMPELVQEVKPEPILEPTAPEPEIENLEQLPILAFTRGIHVVYPTEARRDVLAGRVAYIYIDENGSSVFRPKHIFTALKLNKEQQSRYEDYSCIGAHEWTLDRDVSQRKNKPSNIDAKTKSKKMSCPEESNSPSDFSHDEELSLHDESDSPLSVFGCDKNPLETNDTECFLGGCLFSNDTKGQRWVKCVMCKMWCHVECAGAERDL
ncbi:hypothetical protein FQA39_LY03496 [Lamprigera yunnana]|nr:hypothetical protein FQA39_LY03496 [Lamprigera yunnana]